MTEWVKKHPAMAAGAVVLGILVIVLLTSGTATEFLSRER
jgi:hypothetical protein